MNANDREKEEGSPDIPPKAQTFFDRPLLLLALGMLVMVVFYTLWGIYEIVTLPQSALP